MLTKRGLTCTEAENGAAAVAKVEAQPPAEPFDAILMDFVMPLMDGPTATKAIRALGFKGKVMLSSRHT